MARLCSMTEEISWHEGWRVCSEIFHRFGVLLLDVVDEFVYFNLFGVISKTRLVGGVQLIAYGGVFRPAQGGVIPGKILLIDFFDRLAKLFGCRLWIMRAPFGYIGRGSGGVVPDQVIDAGVCIRLQKVYGPAEVLGALVMSEQGLLLGDLAQLLMHSA
jgi:hypothetical protein